MDFPKITYQNRRVAIYRSMVLMNCVKQKKTQNVLRGALLIIERNKYILWKSSPNPYANNVELSSYTTYIFCVCGEP